MESKSPFCTLSDAELTEKAKELIQELIDSGGKAWTLHVPARPNSDPDLIFTELNQRFKVKAQIGARWVKCSDRLPGHKKRVKWRDGDNPSCITDGNISLFEMEKPYLDGWEWLDESADTLNPELLQVMQDAEKSKEEDLKAVKEVIAKEESGKLTQSRADLIREANNRDLDGVGMEEALRKAQFEKWNKWLVDNGYTFDSEYYYDEKNNFYTVNEMWEKLNQKEK